ncbi:MAG: hypothetical protein ACI35V_08690 [Sphingobacterium composti]|uniref:hypothetical protein n=1 Tax=Sphingobacterium composti TaxID=363260 RepID=UPI001357DB68|nr:hypothetical protein [Sphingobacterium composti Ten et al. 2007 non Yoo et al. 2007]
MNFYPLFGRLGRKAIAGALLITVVLYIQESIGDVKIVEIAKKIEGEFSIQFETLGLTLAKNDSTFMVKFEV